jgi:hypothetical protein
VHVLRVELAQVTALALKDDIREARARGLVEAAPMVLGADDF